MGVVYGSGPDRCDRCSGRALIGKKERPNLLRSPFFVLQMRLRVAYQPQLELMNHWRINMDTDQYGYPTVLIHPFRVVAAHY